MKKKDKKLQTTRMICSNSNVSDLGDILVSDYQNPKDSRGRPKRLLSDNNHIKMIPFRWFVTQTDKVHFVGNTGIVIELIMTYSVFEGM
jgi:hypothetical protein